jgi:adsorption protein B
MVHRIFVILNIFVAVGFLLSGIDDLVVDIFYWLRRLYRKLFFGRRIHPVTEKDLAGIAEKRTAIWIPAWHEHEVIDKMLLNTLESLDYRNYDIFVGTYPNDEGTQLAVETVRERSGRVHKIVCPNPGPTNKADCLNWVFQGMLLAEQEKGVRYEIVVMHDAEDVVHPLELKLLNWLIPRKDMVQLPVIPLEMPARYWTAGTYLDEFAENHSKDLLVRERLGRVIPSAGVGTGLSRRVVDEMASLRKNHLFNVDSVTEDYEFGLKLLPLTRGSILAQYMVLRTQILNGGLWNKQQKFRQVREPLAVREFFPDRFRLAVRQKSRWILGISLQGWKNLRWQGGFWGRYMLYRDRKALFTNVFNALGYIVIGYWLVDLLSHPWGRALPMVPARWVWDVILFDTFLMLHRLLERAVAVHRVAGWKQAFLSIPRSVVGNTINFCATIVAVKEFWNAQRTGQRVAWRKTAHAFPSAQQLREHRRRLGDLLLENRLVTVAQLRESLALQHNSGEKLGQVLTRSGYISEEDLLAVLGRQLRISVCSIDSGTIEQTWLQKLPQQVAEKSLALPVRFSNGVLEVACADPALPGLKVRLEELLGCPVRLSLSGENDIRSAITAAYLPLEGEGVHHLENC